jgi:glyoxylase-like metal-dependent hydrolase (beta-lactamase superfamily II)
MSRISTTAVGTVNVTTLRDGERTLPPEALKNLSDEDIQKINSDENQSFTFTNFNACVIQNGKQNLLVDTGCGSLFGPTCGFILDALDELGLAPDNITDIFITHLHPDHIGGCIDEDGSAVFKNANFKILEEEYSFWTAKEFGSDEINGRDWSSLAKNVVSTYDAQLEVLTSNKDIISGVSTVPLPGHTPGHAGFRVDDGNQSMFHMGDILHVPNLQLKDPNISTLFDVDPESALNSRKYALDMASSDNLLCTSGHMVEPKFIHLEKRGSSYIITS